MHKPTDTVRRFFDKAAYEKYKKEPQFKLKKKDKLFLTEEGNYKDIGRETHITDENVLNAIDLRLHRQKHTEFFYKLDELKDRIEVYNDLFKSNVPRFMKKPTVKVSSVCISQQIIL